MLITVAKVPDHLVPAVRSLVSDTDHQVAIDTEGLSEASPHLRTVSPELPLAAHQHNPPGQGPDLERLYTVVHKGVWPLAKKTFALDSSTIEGVEIIFAGQKLWSRLASEKKADNFQVALAATDFGLELYDVVSRFYPPLQAGEPYRQIAGLLINGTDVTYAAYFSHK